MKLNTLDYIALIITIIGAINWGLIGLFSFNLVDTIFGFMPLLATITYILVGLSGLYMIFVLIKFQQA